MKVSNRSSRRERLLKEFFRNALALALLKQCLVQEPIKNASEPADRDGKIPPYLRG